MVTERGNQGGARARKATVLGKQTRIDEPFVETIEESWEDEGGAAEETLVRLGQDAAGHVMKSDAELGGACGCGRVLCIECAKLRCARCGCLLCRDCAFQLGNAIYCRTHGIQELAGRVLAFVIVAVILSVAAAFAWKLFS